MLIQGLNWDDENIEHINKHNVSPSEVEDVCYGIHFSRRESKGRYILSGQSTSGRYLNVVLELVNDAIYRPITAFDMSENYKLRYRKRLGKQG